MLFRALILCAFAALAAAQSKVLTFTHVPNPITDGEQQAILYATNDTQNPVTIILRKGPSTHLKTVEVLTKTSVGGQFIWKPPISLPDGDDYALEITQGTQVNYFGPFIIQGAQAVSASASPHHNQTHTSAGTAMGTGTAMHRNTTMSHPTLTHHKTAKTTTMGQSQSGSPTFQTPSSSPTGAASPDYTAQSSLALVLGAVAALFYL